VASSTPELNLKCNRCSGELAPGSLVCLQCHALVHSAELERLAAGARLLEERGDSRLAREQWLKALELLPTESTQADWIRKHAHSLELASVTAPPAEVKKNWARKLGPLAPVALALAKGKVFLSIFKLKFLLSLAAFMGFYWTLYGAKFGIGFVVLIIIHEMGHFIDIKRRGLPADMPVFLPGLGAYVRWQALGVTNETRAAISLAGPLAGWIASAACALIWWKTGNDIWAALARAGAWLNVLNLIPVWILDGGQAVSAMSKTERLALLTVCLALWLLLGQSVFFLVALGAGYRLFTKDMPTHPSPAISAYFMGVLTSLGLIMWLMPGKGAGLP
jgi:Zn-dependent protease